MLSIAPPLMPWLIGFSLRVFDIEVITERTGQVETMDIRCAPDRSKENCSGYRFRYESSGRECAALCRLG